MEELDFNLNSHGNQFKEFEYEQECSECGKSLAIMPSEKMREKATAETNDDHIHDWLGEKYFYCKKCQKEDEHRAIE